MIKNLKIISSLRKLSNTLYSKSDIYKSFRWIISFRPIIFTLRYFQNLSKVNKFDKLNPYRGIISSNKGFLCKTVSAKTISILEKTYEKTKENSIFINNQNISAFKEIFSKIEIPISQYLGKKSKLDGINFLIYTGKTNTREVLSSNWHTDNVGARLKVFICFDGDGSKPTVILPPNNIRKSIMDNISIYFLELIRWTGLKNTIFFKKEIKLKHTRGSLIALDTQFLHRGEINNSSSNRFLLVLEFSNSDKHKLFKDGISKGPIGTSSFNEFRFFHDLKNHKSIYNFLDQKRIYKLKNCSEYR